MPYLRDTSRQMYLTDLSRGKTSRDQGHYAQVPYSSLATSLHSGDLLFIWRNEAGDDYLADHSQEAQVGETLVSRHRKHQPQLAVVIGMEHMRGGPGGGHPLILTATLDPHALKQGVRRLALRSLLGCGRTANLRGITVRRLYGAEEMVDEQAKAFADGKRAAAAEAEETAKVLRNAKAVAAFGKGEVEGGPGGFRKRSLWAKYRTQIAPSMAADDELPLLDRQEDDEDEEEEEDGDAYARSEMARRLQARRRGQMSRRSSVPEIEARRTAAIRMQAGGRGGMARREGRRQSDAAATVQARVRGKRTRAQGLLDGITGRPRQSEVEIPSGPRYGFAQPIVVQGCLGGVGVGVDDNNIITALRPGHPAHACGLMELGDRVISIDGVRLAYKGQVWKLAQVMKRSSMHIFGVERRLWEEDEDGNRIPDEDEGPETRGVFQSDVVEPAAVAVADNDDDQPMGSSLAEPGITWQGVAIEITVQVPDKVNAGQRFQFVCPDQAAVLLRCPTPYPHQGRFAWRWHGPGAPVPIDVQARPSLTLTHTQP